MIVRPPLRLPGDIHPFSVDPRSGTVRWTRDGFRALDIQGLLDHGRHELVDGRILPLVPDATIDGVIGRLAQRMALAHGRAALRLRSPLALTTHAELKPHLVLLRSEADGAGERVPTGAETALVVEIHAGDPSWEQRLVSFAEGLVSEVWVLDLACRKAARHRFPEGSGYGVCEWWSETDPLPGLGADGRPTCLRDLLPAPA